MWCVISRVGTLCNPTAFLFCDCLFWSKNIHNAITGRTVAGSLVATFSRKCCLAACDRAIVGIWFSVSVPASLLESTRYTAMGNVARRVDNTTLNNILRSDRMCADFRGCTPLSRCLLNTTDETIS